MTAYLFCGLAALSAAAVAALVSLLIYRAVHRRAAASLRSREQELSEERARLEREYEAQCKELELRGKEQALTIRQQMEEELREQRLELQRHERRIEQKEEALDRKTDALEAQEAQLSARQQEVVRLREEGEAFVVQTRVELERISGLSTQEAKQVLLKVIENEIRLETTKMIRDAEEEAKTESERRARKIISMAIQKCAVDQVSESTVSVVPLPSDELKGRIIGREGRNIRAFEGLTGVDLIIDDTPEAVVISGFDPVRREVARTALTALITDGRIHPGRIEEMVEKARDEVEERMREAAEEALIQTGVSGLHPELVKLLGKLKFRTSYGQNVLDHSVECTHLAGAMAAELGLSADLAKRGALLHDIGKAVDFETDGPHALIGTEIAAQYGEPAPVLNAIAGHHGDVELNCLEAVLVQATDAISASRPGARRESLETYIRRLEKLERIADSYDGVEKAYAIQAGREIRIIVKPENIDDLLASKLARDVARRIEEEIQYPGQIRVTVIREVRAVDYAK